MGIHRSNAPSKSPLQQGAMAGGGVEKQRYVPVKAAEIQDSLAASCPPSQPHSSPTSRGIVAWEKFFLNILYPQ